MLNEKLESGDAVAVIMRDMDGDVCGGMRPALLGKRNLYSKTHRCCRAHLV